MPDLTLFTGSVVVAALVGGWVSLRTSMRNIKVENVTRERKTWREKVRNKALEVHKSAVAKEKIRLLELQLEFGLILNPLDKEDRQILKLINELSNVEVTETILSEFRDRVALLLKHDWERVKMEASPAFLNLFRRKNRVSYEEFKHRRTI